MKNYKFSAEIIKDREIGQYIGIIPGVPGAHSQATTLDELYHNLQDVLQLCIQEMTDEELNNLPDFIGYHGKLSDSLCAPN